MKLSSLTHLVFLFFIAACGTENSKQPNPQVPPAPQVPQAHDPALPLDSPIFLLSQVEEIKFQGHCTPETPLEKCVGGYPLTVFPNREYEIGPGPKEQKFGGFVKKQELTSLLNAVSDSFTSPQGSPPQSGETIQIRLKGRIVTTAHPDVLKQMKSLVATYYPALFPNPCIEAGMELKKAYELVQPCKTANDCTYLTAEQVPLSPAERTLKQLALDDCTYLPSLPVANLMKMVTEHKDLSAKREAAIKACGESLKKPSCGEPHFVNPWASPVRCIKEKCTIGIILPDAL